MSNQAINEAIEREWQNFMYNVAWLRKHYGFSKKRMAELLEISVGSLNKIEKGELPQVSGKIFFNVHKHFGIPPKDQVARRLGDETLENLCGHKKKKEDPP